MRHLQGEPHSLPRNRSALAGYRAEHFLYQVLEGVATITLDRPEQLNATGRRGLGMAPRD